MRSILDAVYKCLAFVGTTKPAAEVEDGIVIFQRKVAEKVIQFLESVPDLRWVGFVGFCVGLVELIQDGFTIGIAQIDGVLVHVRG